MQYNKCLSNTKKNSFHRMFNETLNTSHTTLFTQMGSEALFSLAQETGDGSDDSRGIASYFGLPAFVYAFALVGIYALCWWLIDNLRSLVQLLTAVLTPYFQPVDDKSLVERFGEWAGKS